MQEIAAIVRFHRRKAGLSQVELAELAGLGKTVVFDLEHGKQTIKMDTIARILKVLNITLRFESPLMAAFKESRDANS
jgi:HTH-type transcriptional regulator/antitoxin HipB